MDIVTTHGLTKRYGRRTVVDGLDLRIPAGCVYGFLGPNGAGKSTTMKMLLSLITPTDGIVEVLGQPMNRRTRSALLSQIGSLIESPPGYAHLTGAENLRIVQRTLGLTSDQVDRATRAVRLHDQLDKRVKHYSLGMKQRLGIAMALAREPRLLVLDEPTNGLDPAGIEEMRQLLRHLADGGVTVMVSSHLLGEVDKVADRLGIVSGGRLIFQGTRGDLLASATPDLLVECGDPAVAAAALPTVTTRVETAPAGTGIGGILRVPALEPAHTPDLIHDLVGAGVRLHGVRRDEQSLEDTFMSLTAGGAL